MTKVIELGGKQGFVTVVDDSDWNKIEEYKWYGKLIPRYRGKYHAMTSAKNEDGKYTTLSLHRVIMDCPAGMQVDHINGDTLDNRRSNLRICTPSQNAANRMAPVKNKTGYYGVSKLGNKYSASITFRGERLYLGSFSEPVLAARAYDQKKIELFGEFASTNKKENYVSEDEKVMARCLNE